MVYVDGLAQYGGNSSVLAMSNMNLYTVNDNSCCSADLIKMMGGHKLLGNKNSPLSLINIDLTLSLDIWFLPVILTHCGLVMPYGDRDVGQHWLR